ncbi:hypothetical protein CP8484711_0039A, partial [Chlamydia psittaci 84-8471/1]
MDEIGGKVVVNRSRRKVVS